MKWVFGIPLSYESLVCVDRYAEEEGEIEYGNGPENQCQESSEVKKENQTAFQDQLQSAQILDILEYLNLSITRPRAGLRLQALYAYYTDHVHRGRF